MFFERMKIVRFINFVTNFIINLYKIIIEITLHMKVIIKTLQVEHPKRIQIK